MNGIRMYLIRLVSCGFLISLAGSLPIGKTAKNAVRLCGGCLMLLVALTPLLTVDGSSLIGKLGIISRQDTEQIENARIRNDLLLKRMVEEEASRRIEEKAAEYGAELNAAVNARKEETGGLYVPWEITLTGTCDEETEDDLRTYLLETWAIPPERQGWNTE